MSFSSPLPGEEGPFRLTEPTLSADPLVISETLTGYMSERHAALFDPLIHFPGVEFTARQLVVLVDDPVVESGGKPADLVQGARRRFKATPYAGWLSVNAQGVIVFEVSSDAADTNIPDSPQRDQALAERYLKRPGMLPRLPINQRTQTMVRRVINSLDVSRVDEKTARRVDRLQKRYISADTETVLSASRHLKSSPITYKNHR